MDSRGSWSTLHDDRDPHVAVPLCRGGALICNWFAAANPERPLPGGRPLASFSACSSDQGKTWSDAAEIAVGLADGYACSAPIRQLADGPPDPGAIHRESEDPTRLWRDHQRRRRRQDLERPGADRECSGLYLDAETDVVALANGRCWPRGGRPGRISTSHCPRTAANKWSDVRSAGFKGHCPHFLRHSSGVLLLTHRIP